MPLRELVLTRYEAGAVLYPVKEKLQEALAVTIFGPAFPQRAVEPEMLAGDQRAVNVRISPDQRSIHGIFLQTPPEGAPLRVLYPASQQGQLREPFARAKVKPLPKEC